MFSYEYCEIFKSTFFEEHLRTAASESSNLGKKKYSNFNWTERRVEKVNTKQNIRFLYLNPML